MPLKPLVIGLLVIGLAACSGIRTEEILKSSSNINTVRNQLGLPLQRITKLPGGNNMWTFGSSRSGAMPVTTPSYGSVYGTYGSAYYSGSTTSYVPFTASCMVQIEATESGYIQRWQWQGNNCP